MAEVLVQQAEVGPEVLFTTTQFLLSPDRRTPLLSAAAVPVGLAKRLYQALMEKILNSQGSPLL